MFLLRLTGQTIPTATTHPAGPFSAEQPSILSHDKYHIGMLISKNDITTEITLNLFYFKMRNNLKTSALTFSSRLITAYVTVDDDTVMLTTPFLGSKGKGEKYMLKQRLPFWIRLLN